MHLKNLTSNYAKYNLWANKRLVDRLLLLDQSIRISETPSSYNTIDKTVNHILMAQRFWTLFIAQEDLASFSWKRIEMDSESVLQALSIQSEQLKNLCTSFSEHQLSETLHLNMPWAKSDLCRYEYIQHVINHSAYHRGQVVTMLRFLGIETNIPNTDYHMFLTDS